MIYSIDKVRLRFDLYLEEFKGIFKRFEFESNVLYREKMSLLSYRHNFYFTGCNVFGEKCSYWVGAGHNSKNRGKVIDVVLEYNPNKCNGEKNLEYLKSKLIDNGKLCVVKSFDLAIDIYKNICDIIPNPVGRMNKRVIDNGGDNKTYYFKERNSNGAIKIYNKKRESNLKYDLTRYEITLKPNIYLHRMNSYDIPVDLFIELFFIGGFQLDLDINGTDKVLLLACLEHSEYLRELPRKKKKKIEQLLKSSCSVVFSFAEIKRVVSSFFCGL